MLRPENWMSNSTMLSSSADTLMQVPGEPGCSRICSRRNLRSKAQVGPKSREQEEKSSKSQKDAGDEAQEEECKESAEERSPAVEGTAKSKEVGGKGQMRDTQQAQD